MMTDDEKPKKHRRVNRKRKALNTARATNSSSKVWAVCVDTEKNLWQALVIDARTKEIQCRGDIVCGMNPSYHNLNEIMESDFKRMVEEDEEKKMMVVMYNSIEIAINESINQNRRTRCEWSQFNEDFVLKQDCVISDESDGSLE